MSSNEKEKLHMNRERSYSSIMTDHHGEEFGRFGDNVDRQKHLEISRNGHSIKKISGII